jgi:hypothetical protein
MCDPNFVSNSVLKAPIQNLVKEIFNVENMKFQMRRFQIDVIFKKIKLILNTNKKYL